MVRLKFAIFALMFLGMGVWHIAFTTPRLAEKASAQAAASFAALPQMVGSQFLAKKSEIRSLALSAIHAPSVLTALKTFSKQTPVSESQLEVIRTALEPRLSDDWRKVVFVGLLLDDNSLLSMGETLVTREDLGVDFTSLRDLDMEGGHVPVQGKSYWMVSSTVETLSETGEQGSYTLLLGLPLLPLDGAEQALRSMGVQAIGFVSKGNFWGKGLGAADDEKMLATLANSSSGVMVPLEQGAVRRMGPVGFPFWTHGDVLGNQALLKVGAKLSIPGEALDVVALVSTQEVMESVAHDQQVLLGALGLMLLVSIAGVVFIGGSEKVQGSSMAITGKPSFNSTVTSRGTLTAIPASPSNQQTPLQDDAPRVQEDLLLGKALTSERPRVAAAPPPVPDQEDGDSDETHAYAEAFSPKRFTSDAHDWTADTHRREELFVPPPPTEAFKDGGATLHSSPPEPSQENGGYNPEQTKVSSVPPELLQASSQNLETVIDRASRTLPPVSAAVPSMAADGDETYFKNVFREFLMVREQCGEPSDSIAYEKFAQKLRKYREQLMQKPGVRSVRFQVYVKEGKAQVKASSVR